MKPHRVDEYSVDGNCIMKNGFAVAADLLTVCARLAIEEKYGE